MMCDIDLEVSSVFTWKTQVARKDHRCSCCRARIAARTTYAINFYVNEDTAVSEKCCMPCREAIKAFGASDGHNECNPSYFPEMLESCIDNADMYEDPGADRWRAMQTSLNMRAEVSSERP